MSNLTQEQVDYDTQVREIIKEYQETYTFTEQDVKNFAIFFEDYKEVLKAEGWEIIEAPIERVFEKWKEQQPKIVYYE